MGKIGDKVKIIFPHSIDNGENGILTKMIGINNDKLGNERYIWQIKLNNGKLVTYNQVWLEIMETTEPTKTSEPGTYLTQLGNIIGKPLRIKQERSIFYLKAIDNEDNIMYATFSLRQLFGCCGVCVSYHASVNENYRRKGLGIILNKLRQQIAWENNYTVMICTDKEKNEPQQKILTKNNWKKLFEFQNRKTKNQVGIHAILLEDTGVKIGKNPCSLIVMEE